MGCRFLVETILGNSLFLKLIVIAEICRCTVTGFGTIISASLDRPGVPQVNKGQRIKAEH